MLLLSGRCRSGRCLWHACHDITRAESPPHILYRNTCDKPDLNWGFWSDLGRSSTTIAYTRVLDPSTYFFVELLERVRLPVSAQGLACMWACSLSVHASWIPFLKGRTYTRLTRSAQREGEESCIPFVILRDGSQQSLEFERFYW